MGKYINFEKDLCKLINKHLMENGSNTPDFILARYLTMCLEQYEITSNDREKWYGKKLKIGTK